MQIQVKKIPNHIVERINKQRILNVGFSNIKIKINIFYVNKNRSEFILDLDKKLFSCEHPQANGHSCGHILNVTLGKKIDIKPFVGECFHF